MRVQRHLQQRARGIAGVEHDEGFAAEFLQARRAGAGEAAQVHQFGMAQAGARQAGVVVGVEGNGQVELVRQQALHQLGAVVGVDVEGDAGLGVAAGAHHAGQQAQAESRRAAQPQVAVGAVAQAGGQPAHAAEVLVQARHPGARISASRVATRRPLTRSNSLNPSWASACASSLLAAG